jgi:hypothetical protein
VRGSYGLAFCILACGARSSLDGFASPDAGNGSSDGGIVIDAPADALADAPLTVNVAAPRPVAPLSTSTTTTQRPTFRWVLPSGATGARVEVCADRPCSTLETTFDGLGDSGSPPNPLTAGLHFYRLRALVGALAGSAVSPTWEITVPRRSTLRDTSWSTFPDFNGDGYADVMIASTQVVASNMTIFPGAASGVDNNARSSILAALSFVTALASAGDVDGDGYADLVVGADDDVVYLYRGGPQGVGATPFATIHAPLSTAQEVFGLAVTSAGDVNGDGYADILVSAPSGGPLPDGHAYIYFGGANGPATSPSITLDGNKGGAGGGCGEAGDVDGDGYADVTVLDYPGVDEGGNALIRLRLFRGGPAGPSNASVVTLDLRSVAGGAVVPISPIPGDIDGDGLADLVELFDLPGSQTGTVAVYYGSPSLSSVAAELTIPTIGTGASFAGDVNGDGYDDLLVGVPGVGSGPMLFWGSATGINAAASLAFDVGTTDDYGFGFAVANAGDVNGDGFQDVIVTEGDGARIHVFTGDDSGLASAPVLLATTDGTWFSPAIR